MTDQKPSVGRIVIAVGFKARSNGTDIAPAVITRVFSQRDDGAWCVNVKLLLDFGGVENVTSVYLFTDESAARESIASENRQYMTALHWPERV